MRWPDPMQTPIADRLPERFSLTQLSRQEVPQLGCKVLKWYPNMRDGDGARFTRTEYYLHTVSLKDEVTRDSVVYVGRHDEELMCMVCMERDSDTKNLYGRLGIVDPVYRRSGLGAAVMELIELCARSVGMANVYTYATLHDSAIQRLLERSGYSPVGIIPGRDREYIPSRDEILRVAEVLYIKSLSGTERNLMPSPENMTPAVKRIWQALQLLD